MRSSSDSEDTVPEANCRDARRAKVVSTTRRGTVEELLLGEAPADSVGAGVVSSSDSELVLPKLRRFSSADQSVVGEVVGDTVRLGEVVGEVV